MQDTPLDIWNDEHVLAKKNAWFQGEHFNEKLWKGKQCIQRSLYWDSEEKKQIQFHHTVFANAHTNNL